MSNDEMYRLVNRERIRPGMEERLNRLFTDWMIPDLRAAAPELFATSKTFRQVGGGDPNLLLWTAEVTGEQLLNYGSYIRSVFASVRPADELDELYREFHACVESVRRTALVEVLTPDNPGIAPPAV
ncbi:MAG: hypothetical protein JSS99_15405 [Actinobacteria bacterium]|nr:hypothetical protein [Actinomycetota bacterium]